MNDAECPPNDPAAQAMSPLREDGFLGGRLRIAQPVRGYRAGADAVMLAAACPARAGESVLELGCGAGVAMLCLALRVPGIALSGLEVQAEYADLARRNAAANGIPARIHEGDLTEMPAELRAVAFDHVIANPPYFTAGTTAPETGRGLARHEVTPMAAWIDAALRRLRGLFVQLQAGHLLDALLRVLPPAHHKAHKERPAHGGHEYKSQQGSHGGRQA